jgi:hypothetical protein
MKPHPIGLKLIICSVLVKTFAFEERGVQWGGLGAANGMQSSWCQVGNLSMRRCVHSSWRQEHGSQSSWKTIVLPKVVTDRVCSEEREEEEEKLLVPIRKQNKNEFKEPTTTYTNSSGEERRCVRLG